jgi:hypothetical protein
MKEDIKCVLRFLPLLGFAGLLGGQESGGVELFIQPDIQSEVVATVPIEDPRLSQPQPVMDEARAALGWHFADFRDIVEGYVPDRKIGKDLLPVDNALIHAAPADSSPVLDVYRDGDEIEILDRGPWWKLRLETSFPVYFLLETPAVLPPVTAQAGDALEPLGPAPAPEPATATIIETPAMDADPAETSPTIQPAPSPADRRSVAPEVTGQTYEGRFKRSGKRFGLFAPRAPFYLADASGKRIAWIDTTGIVIPGSLKSFIDQRVIIYGERDFLPGSGDRIIRARNMRIKQP